MTDLTLIPFFADDITIHVTATTEKEFVGRDITLREFADGQPIALYRNETTDDYVAYRNSDNGPFSRAFIEGPGV